MGAIDAKANNSSTMVVESRITYNNEVKENEAVIEAYLGAGMKRQTVGA